MCGRPGEFLVTLRTFICLICEKLFCSHQDDKELEQSPSDPASGTVLSLFERGKNVSTSWLRKSFFKDTSQGG